MLLIIVCKGVYDEKQILALLLKVVKIVNIIYYQSPRTNKLLLGILHISCYRIPTIMQNLDITTPILHRKNG